MKRKFAIALSLVMVMSLFGCAGQKAETAPEESASSAKTEVVETAEGEEVHLEIWFSDVWGNERELPEEEWTINQYARAFEEENPGVTIDVIYQSDQAVAQSKLKAAYSAGTAPDIINTYSGYTVNSFKEILTDITEYIPEEDREVLTGWETVSEDLVIGNAIYGYPEAGNELGIFLYNKELVASAGVDLEGEGAPKNAEEFKAALVKLKEAGILPIMAGDKDKLNELFIWGTGAWWTQLSGSNRIMTNSLAETSFAEDNGFIEVLNYTADLLKEGLVNEDYSEIQDAFTQFLNGNGALYPAGNWGIPEALAGLGDNLGLYCVPSYDGEVEATQIGGVGQSWCVLKSCEHPDVAVKFLSYISQKDYVIAQSQASGKAPQRTDITAEELGWNESEVYSKLLEYCQDVVIWNDNLLQADVANEFYRMTGMVVYGQMTAEECAEEFDMIAQDAAEQ